MNSGGTQNDRCRCHRSFGGGAGAGGAAAARSRCARGANSPRGHRHGRAPAGARIEHRHERREKAAVSAGRRARGENGSAAEQRRGRIDRLGQLSGGCDGGDPVLDGHARDDRRGDERRSDRARRRRLPEGRPAPGALRARHAVQPDSSRKHAARAAGGRRDHAGDRVVLSSAENDRRSRRAIRLSRPRANGFAAGRNVPLGRAGESKAARRE